MEQQGRGQTIVVAVGGNAIEASATSERDRNPEVLAAMRDVARLKGEGHRIVLTHGNGPQVGDLLMQNELASGAVPPATLDVCVAQTQASIGLMMTVALETALAEEGLNAQPVALLTRVRVSSNDQAWSQPTKPIGGLLDSRQRRRLLSRGGKAIPTGTSRWRRVVPSPDPLEIMDLGAIDPLLAAGFIPIVAGGGGVPGLKRKSFWHGVDAVLDKDLTAALMAGELGADSLIIATDVPNVVVHYGRPNARPLHRVTARELRLLASDGHFPPGSMGPKVEAAARFVERSGGSAVITSLDEIHAGLHGAAGTIVEPEDRAA